MKIIIEKNDFEVLLLENTEKDYELFHRSRTACYMDTTEEEGVPYLELIKKKITEDSAGYWQEHFEKGFKDQATGFLVLRQKSSKAIAGMADVEFSSFLSGTIRGEFHSLHILSEEKFRGKHLSKLLWQAGVAIALDHENCISLQSKILLKNKPSWRGAESAGYKNQLVSIFNKNKTEPVKIYILNLEELRLVHAAHNAFFPEKPEMQLHT